jgi:hypothetical protein
MKIRSWCTSLYGGGAREIIEVLNVEVVPNVLNAAAAAILVYPYASPR